MKTLFKFFFLLSLTFSLLLSEQINIEKVSVRTSFENVKISSDEDMGLMGLNYLLEPNDNFYYGVGLYGAVDGIRGGFFVGGFNLGLKYPIYSNLYLDAGAFIGGGGGGSAPQGGGLMLKSYLGGLYRFDNYSLGLNYSSIRFPNGDINSNQIALVADMKFDSISVDTPIDRDLLKNYNFVNSKDYIVMTYQLYSPKEKTLKTDKTPLDETIKLLGIEYGTDISKDFIAYLEAAGAMGGDSTGYMEVLGGVGYTTDIISRDTALQVKVSLGSAGGGQVDTGGGLVSKASINFNLNPIKNLNTGVGAGYYHALEGDFDASFVKFNLGVNTNFLTISESKNDFDYDSISTQKFNIRLSLQSYQYSDTLTQKNNNLDIGLFGFKLDYFIADKLYLSGQALGAFRGEAGGYAAGLFGLGYIQPIAYDFSLVAELGFGAGGGGSIESGGGNILQPMAGLMYEINKSVSI
ncbi:MAG: hypothetical protein U9R50_07610, partial [Campylobacterota bacterium]|nr:hypothetical protein [Campylobacterota bacterium]